MTTDQSHAFGRLVSYYRHNAGLTQAQLAEKVGCTPHYISLIELGKRSPAEYVVGRLAKEMGLRQPGREQVLEQFMQAASHFPAPSTVKIDWGEAPHPNPFYGRKAESSELKQWIVGDHCRIASIIGIGGNGKTSLAAKVTEQIKDKFAYVFWRSIQNAPPPERFLQDCLQFLSDQQRTDLPQDMNAQISLLIEYLREYKCLIVLDNLQAIKQPGSQAGQYQQGFAGYGELLQRVGEGDHQSCLLLTSREQLNEVAHLQGTAAPVRSLRLSGVGQAEGKKIIEDRGLFGRDEDWELFGRDEDWASLIRFYAGNPLALKVVSEYIYVGFAGDIAEFLKEGKPVFADIRDPLEQQFQRMSSLEQEIMFWLAIEREAVSRDGLQEDLIRPVPKGEVLEALVSLRRRSMVEAVGAAGFTLLPVIMEYMTNKLVNRMYDEIETENIEMFASHAFIKAQTKDYIRDSQIRLILTPVKELLLNKYAESKIEGKLINILSKLRAMEPQEQGYAAGNVLNFLIRGLESDLRGYNFSSLKIRQAYLQNANLQEVNFEHANFEHSAFTDIFGSILSVAFSPKDGKYLAAGTANGEIRLWQTVGGIPQLTYWGHTQWVFALAFSPTEDILASGSGDQTIRLWKASTGECLRTLLGHTAWVRSVAFSPDGKQLVSCSEDNTIRLWEVDTGECLRTFSGHSSWVRSVAFSPDSKTIASGSEDTTVCLWDLTTGECFDTLRGHIKGVWSVAFSPDGKRVASGSEDLTIRLWDVKTGQTINILDGHGGAVRPITFNPDGTKLASCSEDTFVRLWDVSTGECIKTLQGHSSWTRSVDFSPDGNILASGSEDQTVRLWDVSTGYCLKVLQGHTNRIRSIAFSPSDDKLVSCSEDKTVSLWDINSGECIRVFREHASRVRTVAFNPNGSIIASGSDDKTIRTWDTSTGKCTRILHGHTNSVRSVAYKSDGGMIASGSDDRTVRLWNVNTGQCIRTLEGHDNRVRSVAFSPDGNILASGSEDQTVRLWDVNTGTCLHVLAGHDKLVWAVAFSPDGKTLASGSEDRTICLWEVRDGSLIRPLEQDDAAQKVRSVAFSPDGDKLASASNDGTIKLWNIETGKCDKTFMRSGGPYEYMNITDAKGLTEAQKVTLRVLGAFGD